MSKPDPIVSEVSRLALKGNQAVMSVHTNALQTGFDKFLENERLCSPNQTSKSGKNGSILERHQ